MTDYEYDENLPYVVESSTTGRLVARFAWRDEAEGFLDLLHISGVVVDTTPMPRVPAHAKFITWLVNGSARWFAERTSNGWEVVGYGLISAIENLPGVTPDTEFTVFEEREKRND